MKNSKKDIIASKSFQQDINLLNELIQDDKLMDDICYSHRKAEELICFFDLLPHKPFTFDEVLACVQHGNRFKEISKDSTKASFFSRKILGFFATVFPDKDTLNAIILREVLAVLIDKKVIHTQIIAGSETYEISLPFLIFYESMQVNSLTDTVRKMTFDTYFDNLLVLFEKNAEDDKIAIENWIKLTEKTQQVLEKKDVIGKDWQAFKLYGLLQRAYKHIEKPTKVLEFLEKEYALYLTLKEDDKDDIYQGGFNAKFANVYYDLNNKKKAIEYVDKAYFFFEKEGKDPKIIEEITAFRLKVYEHFKVKTK
jgi:hypothetical protein